MTGTARDPYAAARAQAEPELARHEMKVFHEDGVYRHIRFSRPDTGMYSFSLVTWPGYLTICGDLEDYTFSRVRDMMDFFAGGPDINPGYWAEKITNPAQREGTKSYSQELFEAAVRESLRGYEQHPLGAVGNAWRDHVLGYDLSVEHEATRAIQDFEFKDFSFDTDWWEWELRDWKYSYLLICFAIRKGVDMYREGGKQ